MYKDIMLKPITDDVILRPIITNYEIIDDKIVVYFSNYDPFIFQYSEEQMQVILAYIEEQNNLLNGIKL